MTISVLVGTELVTSTVTDNTKSYNKNIQDYYQLDSEWQDAGNIYTYGGNSLSVPSYAVGNESSYLMNDVLFKDGETVRVSSVGTATVLKQPEEYTAVADTTFTYLTWTKPFSKIQTGIPSGTYNGYTKTVNGITHRLYRDATSSTGWRYEINYLVEQNYWGTPTYSETSPVSFVYHSNAGSLRLYWNDAEIYVGTLSVSNPVGTIIMTYAGIRYRISTYVKDLFFASYYKIEKELVQSVRVYRRVEASVYTSLDANSVFYSTYCYDGTDCTNKWLGRTFVLRGSDLYVKTQVAGIQSKIVSIPQFSTINSLLDFPLFSKTGVVNERKPFDGKNYTRAIVPGSSIGYTVRGLSNFDTIAFAKVKVDNASIKFINTSLVTVKELTKSINTKRDAADNLARWYTTDISYSEDDTDGAIMEKNSTVEVTLSNNIDQADADRELGSLLLGMSVDAGFTNLEFEKDDELWRN
jgi:hypothetical protein